ncbi:hypothetical protein PYCCODRAFT_1400544, partial [Trametes coccinea BRFM310]
MVDREERTRLAPSRRSAFETAGDETTLSLARLAEWPIGYTPQPLLDRAELTSIFSNFIDIWNLHRSFYVSLTAFLNTSASARPSDPPPPLSPVLLAHFPYLSLYTPFVSSFSDALASYAALLKSNGAFAAFIAHQEA